MLKAIFSTATFKQSQITVIGTIINGALGAGFYILLARFLGPFNFGLLILSVATLTLIADIVDFGTNTGLVRFVSSNIASNKEKAWRFLKLSLEVKFVIWIAVFALGTVFSPFVADKIFGKPELALPLKLVMFGVGGALLFSYATASLQALQKYFTWSFVNILTNLFRLLIILMLFFYGQLGLISGLLVYLALPFFGFSLALFFLPSRAFLVKNEFSVAKDFFKFNFWVAAFTIVAAISARLDIFLTGRLLSAQEVGIYGAAIQLVSVVPQIVGALGIVAAPKFASFVNIKQMLNYLKKFQLMVIGLSVLGLLAIPLSYWAIPIIFGQRYIETVFPFIILFLAMLTFLISVPIHNSIIYYFGKPQVFVWVSIGHLFLIGFLGFLLISNYGVVGAAMAVLLGMVFNFLAPLAWFLIKIRK